MNKSPLISVIIPNWNGSHLLKVSLPSIKRQSFRDFEVIIVDNGSDDDSIQYIQKNFPQFGYIKLKKNLGFSGAVNKGIKKAMGKYLFLLNNDTELDKKCLEYLTGSILLHPESGGVTAKMLNFYRRDLIDNAGDNIDQVGHLYPRGYRKKDSLKYNQPGYTFLVTGGGSLFKKELFKEIGLFDESFFCYMEDADLSLRAQLAGFKFWYEPKALIYHQHMATASKNLSLAECLNFRNMTMMVIKNFPKDLLLKDYNWLKIILVHLNTLRYLIGKGYFWETIKSEAYILANLVNLIKKRQQIQKTKAVSDQYIMRNIQIKRFRWPDFMGRK